MTEILGVVAEYNPLHAGHLYQLQTAKKETGCNTAIVALSGNFVQRGEPALVPKRVRTAMALAAGADLVIEIPTALVLSSAEGFAQAGVEVLKAAGVTVLSFGSESGSVKKLQEVAAHLNQQEVQARIAPLMKEGLPYAGALQLALGNLCTEHELVSKANNILALEYIRTIMQNNYSLRLHTVKRMGPGHGSLSMSGYSSATAIRRAVQTGTWTPGEMELPGPVREPLSRALDTQKPVFLEALRMLILEKLRRPGLDFSKIKGMGEGLENRIQASAAKAATMEELITLVKTKRYPRTRIQRSLCCTLLGITQDLTGPVPYLRVLGFSPRGKEHLSVIAKSSHIPLVVKASDAQKLNPNGAQYLAVDLLAASIHSVAGRYPFSSDLSFAPVLGRQEI